MGFEGKELFIRNGTRPAELEYCIEIEGSRDFDVNEGQRIKQMIKDELDIVLHSFLINPSTTNTFNIVIPNLQFQTGSSDTLFNINISVVHEDPDGSYARLAYRSTGAGTASQWGWSPVPDSTDLTFKSKKIKNKYWKDVRYLFLRKKNMYLGKINMNHPSFVCYAEAVNEVYKARIGDDDDQEF